MPPTWALLFFQLLLISLLAGCALPPEPKVDLPEPPDPPYAAYAPPQWDRAGLEVQPRLAAYRGQLPGDLSYEPGTTAWRETQHEIPPSLTVSGDREDSPGLLLQALITDLDLMQSLGRSLWEQTQRLYLEDGRAVGVVLQWGLQDDAIQGRDYRVWMSEDARGWYVERVEIRYHCGRGVNDKGLCL